MIAALGMYDRPELTTANNALWTAIRDALGRGPEMLSRNVDFWDVWRSPDLLLSQTCGLPYRMELYRSVSLVGTPDYGLEGCPPGYYRSLIVGRKGAEPDLRDMSSLCFAYNERKSQSGWAAFWSHLPVGCKPKSLEQSGGHRLSAEMVADGRADIAALDAVSFNIIRRFDSFADKLTILDRTEPTPGLPFITAQHGIRGEISYAVSRAIEVLESSVKTDLQLQGLVQIPKDVYLTVPLPPN